MRRMLDPKEVGGGGSTRHHYTIIAGSTKFHYEVYTTKEYGYEPRKLNTVWDFKTNNKFQELRAPGYYPASGTWKDANTGHIFIANWIQIDSSNKIKLCGYDITETGTPAMLTEFDLASTNYQIIQNY